MSRREIWVKEGPEEIGLDMRFTIDWNDQDKVVISRQWATLILLEAGYQLQEEDTE